MSRNTVLAVVISDSPAVSTPSNLILFSNGQIRVLGSAKNVYYHCYSYKAITITFILYEPESLCTERLVKLPLTDFKKIIF